MEQSVWINVSLFCLFKRAVEIGETLERHGALSTSIHASDDARTTVTALFDEESYCGKALQSELRSSQQDDAEFQFSQYHLHDRDWVRESQQSIDPVRVSDRLQIVAPWHEIEPSPNKLVIINPGLSFGTGHHETTRMCAEFLCEKDIAGATVIDYGCGSGVLAITALTLGAKFAWGVDLDPDAVMESRANAKRNGVQNRYLALMPDQIESGLSADIVVANLFSGALQDLSEVLTNLVKPHGWLALSGILSSQVDSVTRGYTEAFDFSIKEDKEWILLTAQRQ